MGRLTIGFLVAVAPALSICLALLGLETMRSNAMGWFLLVFGIAYPAGGAIYYFITRKPFWSATTPGGTSVEERGDPSFWAILPGFLVIFFAAPLEWTYLSGWMPRLPWMQGAGLGLILASILVHAWARIQIGGQYSGHLEVAGGQRLVQSGPYRCVRHPGYSGFLLMALGIATGYASLIGLICIPLLLLPGIVYRIRVEERLLTKQFGYEYLAYKGKTKKLIPGVW